MRRWRTPVQKRDGDRCRGVSSHADRRIEIRRPSGGCVAGRRRASCSCPSRPPTPRWPPGTRSTTSRVTRRTCASSSTPWTTAGTNYGTHAVIAVTAWSANTTVYYDHWEDGYDFDPANPGTADETVILVEHRRPAGLRVRQHPDDTRRGTTTCYDGGDRIYVAGGVVTVTRASWIEARRSRQPVGGVGDLPRQATAHDLHPALWREPGLRRLQPGVRSRPGHRRQHHVHRGPERRRICRHAQPEPGRRQDRSPATRPRSRCSEARPSSSTA